MLKLCMPMLELNVTNSLRMRILDLNVGNAEIVYANALIYSLRMSILDLNVANA